MFKVVFTDLDGTLLDKDYSYSKSFEAVNKLKEEGIPLIFCTSKTFKENLFYREKLKLNDPFIIENGSAILIPKNYFDYSFPYSRTINSFKAIILGRPYKYIRKSLIEIRDKYGLDFKGFGDLSLKELSRITNLPLSLARLAKEKQFNESIFFLSSKNLDKKLSLLEKELREKGLRIVKGTRFLNVFGINTSKGKAVKELLKIYRFKHKRIKSFGIGDGLNDLPMLRAVRHGFFLSLKKKSFNSIKIIHKLNGDGFSFVINNYVLK